MVHISTFSLQCYRRVGFVTLSDTGERKVAQIFNFSSWKSNFSAFCLISLFRQSKTTDRMKDHQSLKMLLENREEFTLKLLILSDSFEIFPHTIPKNFLDFSILVSLESFYAQQSDIRLLYDVFLSYRASCWAQRCAGRGSAGPVASSHL